MSIKQYVTKLYNKLFPLKPGDFIIREMNGKNRHIYMFVGFDGNDKLWRNRVVQFGNIGYNINGIEYASMVYNTKTTDVVKLRENTFRKPTRNELKLIKSAFKKKISQRYIENAFQLTGISPRV